MLQKITEKWHKGKETHREKKKDFAFMSSSTAGPCVSLYPPNNIALANLEQITLPKLNILCNFFPIFLPLVNGLERNSLGNSMKQ